MMPKGKNLVRLLWAVLFVIFLAAVLPRPLGHPYPPRIEPYVVLGGIAIYVVGGLCLVVFLRRLQGPSSK